MDRRQWHHSRHLIHYGDQRADPTCSLHCAALSLSLNIDRSPAATYAADYGAAEPTKPLVDVDAPDVRYLVGSQLPGTMSRRSKMAFADPAAAQAALARHGGELLPFDGALTAAYLDMAQDTALIRARRAERRHRRGPGGRGSGP
jgi:nitrous oxide reductase accessory protein NosL